ncbi:hypothetical protein U4I66_07990 [Stenotrophomonas maltophilia]|uniref:hypothetical protein n=1 Tax=Stenotrophomonas maltophilia TaxID=40324 RepID=UPI002ACCDC02|nr:hypothetical protein [Stenotrophomonas maltophilia]MDZ5841778.1 hypothetical protein [Stenotrophomonas maltophilia]
MQARKLTLVEIGVGALPSASPVAPRFSTWFPVPFKSPDVPPTTGVNPTPVADGVVLEWDAVDLEGVIYVISRSESQNGPWTEIFRTTETRYVYSDGSGKTWWFQITPTVRGKPGTGTVVGVTPPTTSADLSEQQAKLAAEVNARIQAIADEAAARAAGLAQAAADLVAEALLRQQGVNQAMQAVSAEAQARIEAVLNEKMAREAAITREEQLRQSADESLARAVSEVAAGSGTQFDSIMLWPFNQTTEGWAGNGAPTLVDGWLRPANHATAPWVQSPVTLAVDGSAYRFVKLRVKRVGSPTWSGFLQWITTTDQAWNTQKRATIAEPAWDVNGVATVDVQDIAWWPATVDAIRLQLGTSQTVSNYYLIDYIAVGRPQPGASVALVQEETQARITADAAEASQRTALAVQMRGNYTGTDPAQLTAGLAYEELRARVAADSSQVQRISTMEARMPAGSGALATSARVDALQEATATTTNALAQSITTINATLPAMIVQGSNHALNGTWESGRDVGWTYLNPGTTLNVVNEGRSGLCLRVDGGTGVRQALVNGNANVPVVPGRTYRVSCWYKTTPDYNGTSSNGKLRLGNQTGGQIGSNTFGANRVEWTYTERVHTVPTDGSVTAYRLGILADNTTGTLWVDDVMIEEVTELIANAQGLVALTNTVTQQGQQITAQAGLISALRTDVDGKASNSALQSLQSQVTLQGSDITSLGQSVTNITASLNSIGGDNQLANSGFELGTAAGWTAGSGNVGSAVFTRTLVDSSLPGSTKAYRLAMSGLATNGYGEIVSNASIKAAKVEPGRKVAYSAYVRGTPGARFFMQIAWVNAEGGVISYTGTPSNADWVVPAETWTRMVFVPTNPAPANAVAARCYLRCYGTGAADQWVEWDNVQLQVGSVATGYMPSMDELSIQTAANANATATLSGTVTQQGQLLTSLGQSVTTVNAQLQNVGGDNLLPNSSFENSTAATTVPTGWNVESAAPTVAISYVGSPLTGGGRAVRLDATTTAANQWIGLNIPDSNGGATLPRIRPNTDYMLTSYVRGTAGCTVQVIAQWRNAQNGVVGTTTLPPVALSGEWQRLSLPARTTGAAADRVRVYVGRITSPTAQPIFVEIDNVMLQQGEIATNWVPSGSETATRTAANAAATSALTTTVTQQGTKLDATAEDLSQLKTQVGNVSATAFSQMQSTVQQHDGRIAANSLSIQGLQVEMEGIPPASVVQKMEASIGVIGGSPNLLGNALLKSLDGWGSWWSGDNTGVGSRYAASWQSDGGIPWGNWGLIITGATKAGIAQVWGQDVPIKGDEEYVFSAYVSGNGWGAALVVEWLDAAGATVGVAMASQEVYPIAAGGPRISEYTRISIRGRAPAAAAQARPILRYYVKAGATNGFIRMVQPQLEVATPGQAGPSAFNVGGNESRASWSVDVRSDGKIAGIRVDSHNGSSAFDVLADVFRVSSPSGGRRTEYSDGNWRCYDENGVMRARFGVWGN